MGFSTQSKGYKFWDLESNKIVVSRDVTFDESSTNSSVTQFEISEDNSGNDAVPGRECKIELADNIDLFSVASEETNDAESENSDNEVRDAQNNPTTALKRQAPSPTPPLRRSKRVSKKPSAWWKATGLLAFALSAKEVPTSFKVAISPDNISFWKPGIDREHDCLLRNGTWGLVNYTPDMKVLPCKYEFKIKENKPKVRLVALGCRQSYGIDYNETFAPVVTLTTVRTILAMAAHLD